jgi:hypothetical protein
MTRWPYRIDSLLGVPPPGVAVALVAQPSLLERTGGAVDARFLPHDSLTVLSARTPHGSSIIRLPPYITPPGLARSPAASAVYVAVDTALLRLDPSSGRITARWRLDIQSLGWPAAVTAATNGRVYIAGQRYDTGLQTAMIEALDVTRSGSPHVIWRSRLGITHAGIWVGVANHQEIVAYAPDMHDVSGTISLLDARSGALRGAYWASEPPTALDPLHNRIYFEGAGIVRALTLDHGIPVGSTAGTGPLAVAAGRGLIALTRTAGGYPVVLLASARTLAPRARVLIHARGETVRALAFSPDTSRLVVGLSSGWLEVNLKRCRAE